MKIALLFTFVISVTYAQSDNSTQSCVDVGKCSTSYCTRTADDCYFRRCEDSCGNTKCTKAVLNDITMKWSYSDCSESRDTPF